MNIPEIDVQEFETLLKSEQEFVLLDVREPWELARATWTDFRLRLAPLSQLSQQGVSLLPSEAQDQNSKIIVACHHGIRSANVTGWLLQQGWTEVVSLRGGIDAYAIQIDPTVGKY